MFAPLVIYVFYTQPFAWTNNSVFFLGIASAMLCVGYNFILFSYKFGDYSVMYPIMRGTGPLTSTAVAIAVLSERPSLVALVAIVMILVGVFIIGDGIKILTTQKSVKPIALGVFTGIIIGLNTVIAKYCISNLGIPFVFLEYGGLLLLSLVLAPYVVLNRDRLKDEWKENSKPALGVGFLRSATYILVLWVLVTTDVYYVAPLREMSILFAAIIGTKFLKEGHLKKRLIAAVIIFAGVVVLALN